MRVIFLLVFLLFTLPLYAQKPAKPDEPVKDPVSCSMLTDGVRCVVLRQMMHYFTTLESFKADFRMEQYNKQLNISDSFEGTVAAKRDAGQTIIRVEFVRPVKETMYLENGQFTLYKRRMRQAVTVNLSQRISELFGMSDAQLKEQVEVGEYETAGGVSGWRVSFKPRSTQFSSIDMTVNYSEVSRIALPQKNGDRITVVISNMQRNQPMKLEDIRFRIPKGTQIVKTEPPDELKY